MNSSYLSFVFLLGVGTLLVDALLVIGLILYLVSFKVTRKSALGKISDSLKRNSTMLGFLIAVVATVGSLFLSEIVRFPPCELCWYQRIFMYPQVIILGIALVRENAEAKFLSLVLSIIGLLIAVYHIFLQLYPATLPCTDAASSCAFIQFKYFGYITIPFMSATTFAALILVMAFGLRNRHAK